MRTGNPSGPAGLAAGAALIALLLAAGLTVRGQFSARAAARADFERAEALRVEREHIDDSRRAAANAAQEAEVVVRKTELQAPVEANP
ncbi:MAG: hypothetical protein K8T20_03805 [Planctomycetes bacterium]|nr:hypothetical protein [Planctomycetota bacterium]